MHICTTIHKLDCHRKINKMVFNNIGFCYLLQFNLNYWQQLVQLWFQEWAPPRQTHPEEGSAVSSPVSSVISCIAPASEAFE